MALRRILNTRHYKLITPIDTPWIYHNSDLWLISLSSDGSNWITIADKNLWATQVYNDGDTLSEANAWKYYQWGNNYGFSYWVSPSNISSTQVNAGTYWPWNYYSSSTFITVTWNSLQDNSWDSSYNENLRWWVTWTVEAMQWPCAAWYHIPSKSETDTFSSVITSLWVTWVNIYLKVPFAWRILWNNGTRQNMAAHQYFWNSNIDQSEPYLDERGWYVFFRSDGTGSASLLKSAWLPIRPFKNEAVQPDDSRTKLY